MQAADERRERAALGFTDRDAFSVAPAERIIKRLAPGVHVRSAYPVFEDDGFVFTHGHYLSSHLEELGWRSFDRRSWWIWGQQRRSENLSAADYEALMTPLYELCYTRCLPREGRPRLPREVRLTVSRPWRSAPQRSCPFPVLTPPALRRGRDRDEADTRLQPLEGFV